MSAILADGLTGMLRPGRRRRPGALRTSSLEVAGGRDLRLPRSQRRRQEHADPAAARLPAPDRGAARRARPRHRSRSRSRSARRIGYLPGRHRALRRPDRRGAARRPGATVATDRRSGAPTSASGWSSLADAAAPGPRLLARHAPEDRASSRRCSTTRELAILDEPSEGPRSADAARVLRHPRRAARRGTDGVLLIARAVGGGAGVRPGRDRAAPAGWSRSRTSATLLARRARRVELRVEGAAPDLRGVPGGRELEADDGRVTCTPRR